MRDHWILRLTILACAISLVGATEASAAKKISVSLQPKASKGYDVSISASYFQPGQVQVFATSKDGSSASYTTTGSFSASKIKANFAGLGKISAKFHAKGKPVTSPPPKGCTGPDTVSQKGNWTGKISFKGENGYTKVSTTKAPGYSSETVGNKPLDCGNGGGGGQPQPKDCVSLSYFVDGFSFSAEKIEGESPAFSANVQEVKNGVTINRFAQADGGTFTADTTAQTASLSPPSPFSGSGTYADGMLSGSLSVNFPGETKGVSGEAFLSNSQCF